MIFKRIKNKQIIKIKSQNHRELVLAKICKFTKQVIILNKGNQKYLQLRKKKRIYRTNGVVGIIVAKRNQLIKQINHAKIILKPDNKSVPIQRLKIITN